MIKTLDKNYTKACVFCSYWGGLAGLKQKTSISSSWEFESNKKGLCIKKKRIMVSDSMCSDYICKIK